MIEITDEALQNFRDVMAENDRLRKLIARRRRHKLEPGQCAYCDRERAANNDFHPSHDASERCESGKHSHCSCDACF